MLVDGLRQFRDALSILEIVDLLPIDLQEQAVKEAQEGSYSSIFDELISLIIVSPLEVHERKVLRGMTTQ